MVIVTMETNYLLDLSWNIVGSSQTLYRALLMHFCILYLVKNYLQFHMYLHIQVSDGLLYVVIFLLVSLFC